MNSLPDAPDEERPGLDSARIGPGAIAALAMSCSAAMADPTTLVCENGLRPDQVPHLTIALDESKGTVTINYPVTSVVYPGSAGPFITPAQSAGPLPAKFDSTSIVFDRHDRESGGFYEHFTIDRVTAVLIDYQSMKAPFDQASSDQKVIWRYTCRVGKAQF
jgi:hypothetical protein